MLPFPKSRFPTCSAYRFWNRLQKPYPACFLMPNSKLFSCRFSVIILRSFLNLCLVSPFLLLIWFVISVIPLWETAGKILSTIIGKLPTVWRGILQKIFQIPFTIYGHLQSILWGFFWKIFIPPHYYWKVLSCLWGCFWKNSENFHIK